MKKTLADELMETLTPSQRNALRVLMASDAGKNNLCAALYRKPQPRTTTYNPTPARPAQVAPIITRKRYGFRSLFNL
jgi:hypothetical protein